MSQQSDIEHAAARAALAAIIRLLPRLSPDQRRELQAVLKKLDEAREPPDFTTLIG